MKINIRRHKLIFLIITIIIFSNCRNDISEKNEISSYNWNLTDTIKKIDTYSVDTILSENDTMFFPFINDYPNIKDTVDFIKELRNCCKFEVDENYDKENFKEDITKFEKISIFGSEKDYYLIEYDYHNGCMAGFPWKYQLIFSENGKLIKTLWAIRYEMIEIFSNENPFLLTVVSTSRGNGGHEIYKMSADTLENIFEGFTDYFPRTYDGHENNNVNEPNELNLKIIDANKDGYNDLVFWGKIIHNRLSNDIDDKANNIKINVEYIFEYNNKFGHFIEKENYSKKYIYLDK